MGMKFIVMSTLSALLISPSIGSLADPRCFPGQSCWPTQAEIGEFTSSLVGEIYQPNDDQYHVVNTYNQIVFHRSPAFVVFVTGVNDVKACMKFAKKHNILVTIKSTGHSYNGRSTHDGSLQINMLKMKGKQVQLTSSRNDAGEITVETGNTWKEIYLEVDKHNRVVVGGSSHTVSPGGLIQGGGHSPLCRSLGLAVDQLLEVQIVTSDGKLVTARENETVVTNDDGTFTTIQDGDLLWAIRGGGGGVWGVIINYTLKLHHQPSQIVYSTHVFSLISNDSLPGNQTLKDLFRIINNFPDQWGGYLLFNNVKSERVVGDWGYVLLVLNHFGEWGLPSRQAINDIIEYSPLQIKHTVNKTSFMDYEKDIKDWPLETLRTYTVSGFLQNDTNSFDAWVDDITEQMMKDKDGEYSIYCTGTLIGGKASVENSATSVSPNFRSGRIVMTCVSAWENTTSEEAGLAGGRKLNEGLLKHGKGVYYNEAAYDLSNWKEEFWGGNYDRLLEIKRRWDPDNFLWCYHCVGSDLSTAEKKPPVECVGEGHMHDAFPPVILLVVLLSSVLKS